MGAFLGCVLLAVVMFFLSSYFADVYARPALLALQRIADAKEQDEDESGKESE